MGQELWSLIYGGKQNRPSLYPHGNEVSLEKIDIKQIDTQIKIYLQTGLLTMKNIEISRDRKTERRPFSAVTEYWLRVSQAKSDGKNILGRANRLFKLHKIEKSLLYLRYLLEEGNQYSEWVEKQFKGRLVGKVTSYRAFRPCKGF